MVSLDAESALKSLKNILKKREKDSSYYIAHMCLLLKPSYLFLIVFCKLHINDKLTKVDYKLLL